MSDHQQENLFTTLSDDTSVQVCGGSELYCDAGHLLSGHKTNGAIFKRFPKASWKCFDCHQDYYGEMSPEDTKAVAKLTAESFIAYHINQLAGHTALLKSIENMQ